MDRPTDEGNPDTFLLLERYRAGDSAALDAIIRRHYPRVERIVSVRLRGAGNARADIADIVQETMIRAIQNLSRFEHREEARLIHWLARIAENQVVTFHKRRSAGLRDHRREVAHVDAVDTGGVDPQAADETPSRIVAERDDWRVLDECIASLPDEQREAILLRDFAGASWEFLADELKRPSAEAARKVHQRARIALQEKVSARRGLLPPES